MIAAEELKSLLEAKAEDTEIIFTGRMMDESIREYADEVYCIQVEK